MRWNGDGDDRSEAQDEAEARPVYTTIVDAVDLVSRRQPTQPLDRGPRL